MLWDENEDSLLRTQNHSRLKWVILNGELRDVSDFAHLPANERPQVSCPVCSRPVTMKLGKQRVHHCAHQPGDECVANHPETALHLNMKFHLYRQLQQVGTLFAEQRCKHCNVTRQYAWAEGWDTVEVEYSLDRLRPDIALLANGEIIAAIEVFVTHAVDDDKAQYLNSKGIPWIEVFGQERFYSGETAWNGDQPLTFFRQQPEPERWICETCQERLKRQADEEEFRQKNYTGVICFRVVDFFYPDKKRYRDIYRVVERVKNDERVEVQLIRGDKKMVAKIIASKGRPIPKTFLEELHEKLKSQADQFCKNGGNWDSPMEWISGDLPEEYEMLDEYDFPPRYVWWPKEAKWFMPKANRQIHWNRIKQTVIANIHLDNKPME
jgi:hypothetical protein